MTVDPRRWRETKKQIHQRDNGLCVRCSKIGTDVHHRLVKGIGGTSDENIEYGLDNLILLCRECHTYVHGHPRESYQLGYLVHSWDDPAEIPVGPSDYPLFLAGV